MYASVLLTRNTKAIDMAFTYSVPPDLQGEISEGQQVIVPFGRGDILNEAYVLALETEKPKGRLKAIYQIVDPKGLSTLQLQGIAWLRATYLCTYSEAIQVFSPPGSKLVKTTQYKLLKAIDGHTLDHNKLKEAFGHGPLGEAFLKEHDLEALVKVLRRQGYVEKIVHFKQKTNPLYQTMVTSTFDPCNLEDILKGISQRAIKQREIIKFMAGLGSCRLSDLAKAFGASKASLTPLIKKGLLKCDKVLVNRRPEALMGRSNLEKNPLSCEQERLVKAVGQTLTAYKQFLIQGVTGSGKTEVYMALVDMVIKAKKQVIILVPEIALTPQMVGKFFKRFGANIAVVHSKLSAGERYDQYQGIASGDINIVIGARSAIFSPCENLGLVILDEAHESSYKSDSNPKYSAVEVAEYLCRHHDVPLILASATPSVDQYYRANEAHQLLSLQERYNKKPLPFVYLVDMKEELVQGNKSMFSELLLDKIQDRLEKKEQVILFFNKKGYASFVSCRTCAYVMKCPRCDVALTYHHKDRLSKCGYCDYKTRVPKTCPSCKSGYFKFFGSGTEKVESLLKETFTGAKIARLDSESTAKKGSLEAIIKAMENREIDILLGTQMVAKGLDFQHVTLVGALSADMSLNLPDYMASEKTFQLLTQVAGRAGRGQVEGEVVIQSYEPDHYAIQASVSQDYLAFYEEEIQVRQAYGYPPFVDLVSILIVGPHEQRTIDSAFNLYGELKRFIHSRIEEDKIEILGPNPCIIQKINHKFRWQIILKFDKKDLDMVRNIIHYVCITHRKKVVTSDVYIGINIKPLSLL